MTVRLVRRVLVAALVGVAVAIGLGFPLPSSELSTPASYAGPGVLRLALAAAAWIAVLLLVVSALGEWVRVARAPSGHSRISGARPSVLVLLVGLALLGTGVARTMSTFSVCCGGPQTVREALLHAR